MPFIGTGGIEFAYDGLTLTATEHRLIGAADAPPLWYQCMAITWGDHTEGRLEVLLQVAPLRFLPVRLHPDDEARVLPGGVWSVESDGYEWPHAIDAAPLLLALRDYWVPEGDPWHPADFTPVIAGLFPTDPALEAYSAAHWVASPAPALALMTPIPVLDAEIVEPGEDPNDDVSPAAIAERATRMVTDFTLDAAAFTAIMARRAAHAPHAEES